MPMMKQITIVLLVLILAGCAGGGVKQNSDGSDTQCKREPPYANALVCQYQTSSFHVQGWRLHEGQERSAIQVRKFNAMHVDTPAPTAQFSSGSAILGDSCADGSADAAIVSGPKTYGSEAWWYWTVEACDDGVDENLEMFYATVMFEGVRVHLEIEIANDGHAQTQAISEISRHTSNAISQATRERVTAVRKSGGAWVKASRINTEAKTGTLNVGHDWMGEKWTVGLGATHARTDGNGYDAYLSTLHPYAALRPLAGVTLWGVLGTGHGQITMEHQKISHASNLDLMTVGLGADYARGLFNIGVEGAWARANMGETAIAGARASTRTLRAYTNATFPRDKWTPSVEIGLRSDSDSFGTERAADIMLATTFNSGPFACSINAGKASGDEWTAGVSLNWQH